MVLYPLQATTPDPGGVQSKPYSITYRYCPSYVVLPCEDCLFPAVFLTDFTGHEPEGFSLLTPDLPARKR